MPKRDLTREDIQNADSPKRIAALFRKLGYDAAAEPVNLSELELPCGCAEMVQEAYLIADVGDDGLQVLLFELASSKLLSSMRAIAPSFAPRNSYQGKTAFLLLGTFEYQQLIVVNPREGGSKYWQMDLITPSYYDLHRLEAIAAVTTDPEELYTIQEEAFDLMNKRHSRQSYTTDSLRLYLRKIGPIPLLQAAEEIELAANIGDLVALEGVEADLATSLGRKPDGQEWADAVGISLSELRYRLSLGRQAKNKMISSNLRLVVSMAKKYQKRGMELEDLIQEGTLGLIRGTEKFDSKKGYRFSTYAYWWIQQSITRAICNQSRTVRLPVHLWETMSRIKNKIGTLTEEMGRTPTKKEVADRMKITVEKLRLVANRFQPILSLDLPVEGKEYATLVDSLPFEGPTVEEEVGKILLREDLEKVLTTLSTREQEVLLLRYGLENGKGKELEEIGRLFNLTRERIRQIEAKALRKLRNRHRNNILKGYI